MLCLRTELHQYLVQIVGPRTTHRKPVQVTVGRLGDNTICIEDSEVSSTHCLLTWDASKRVWQVMDLGSLNGTRLNGNFISNTIRRAGKNCRLGTDDILLLGSRTAIKVPLPHTSGGGGGLIKKGEYVSIRLGLEFRV